MPWKVFTHDWRSPIQGGAPLWDGTLPHELPPVALDTSDEKCGAGWNYCESLSDALRIGGLWPNGRPSMAVAVEPGPDAIRRGDKCRSSTLRLVRLATQGEVTAAIRELSAVFDPHVEEMVREQIEWRSALMRPLRDSASIELGLAAALEARGLAWETERYDSAREVWAALRAMGDFDAWDAREAWYPTSTHRHAAPSVWSFKLSVKCAFDAWGARGAKYTMEAWAAREAMILRFASRDGLVAHDAEMLTKGIRDAYTAGLAVAMPVGTDRLGWAMEE